MNMHVNAATPRFIDPATLPKGKYAHYVAGDCLAPEIPDGAAVVIDPRAPIEAGDLAVFYFKAGIVGPQSHSNAFLKRVALNMMPGVRFPYTKHPDSNVMPVFIVAQDNPARQYTLPADQLLAVHRCLGVADDSYTLVAADRKKPARAGRRTRRPIVAAAHQAAGGAS